MKVFTYLLVATLSVLLLLVTAAVLLVVLIHPNDFRPEIQKLAQDQGIELELGGDIDWHFYPFIGFELNQATLHTADRTQQLLEVGRITLSLALLDLLYGNIHIKGIELADASVALVRDAQGKGNWEQLIAADNQETTPVKQQIPGQDPDKGNTSSRPPAHDRQSPDIPSFIQNLQSGFIRFNNIALSFEDQASNLAANLTITSFSIDSFNFGEWFPLQLDLTLGLNNPKTTAGINSSWELQVAEDLQMVKLRNLKLAGDLTTQPLGDNRQEIQLDIATMQLHLPGQQLHLEQVQINATARVPQLGEEPQRLQLTTNVDFGLESGNVVLNDLQLNLDAAIAQLGNARQTAQLGGVVRFAVKGLVADIPQLSLDARLTYPAFLTEQLHIQSNLDGTTANLQDQVISNRLTTINIADHMQVQITDTQFDSSEGKTSSNISIDEFNPKTIMQLIKVGNTRLTSLLPQMANPNALETLALDTRLGATIDPLQLQATELKLVLDQTTLTGSLGMHNLTSVTADLHLDQIDLDGYLPAPSKPSPADKESQPTADKKTTTTAAAIYSKDPLLPVDLLKKLSADLRLRAEQVKIRQQQIQAIDLRAKNDGNKATAQVDAKAFDGRIAATAAITSLADTPAIQTSLSLTALDLLQLQTIALDQPMVAGKGEVTARLNASGVSIHDWVHSLSGPLKIQMRKGELLGINISRTFCEAVSKAQGSNIKLDNAGANTSIQSLLLAADFTKGKGNIRRLDIGIPDLGAEARGTIDLPGLAFNIPLEIWLRGNSLGEGCALPAKVRLPLICAGRVFEDSPLHFCRPDLSRLQLQLQEFLEQQKRLATEKLEAAKRAAEEKLAAEKRAIAKKLEEEQRAAERKLQQELEKEKRKQQKQLEDTLKNELQKLF